MNAGPASVHSRMDSNEAPGSSHGTGAAIHSVHLHRRVFIGPMPERVVSQAEAHAHKHYHKSIFLGRTSSAEDDAGSRTDISQLVKDHALHFFMCEGGKVEDWDAEQERSRTEELLERWRKSEWGAVWHRRHRQQHGHARDLAPSHWVGGSFEVGHLLGVNVLEDSVVTSPAPQELDSRTLSNGEASTHNYAATSVQGTFLTAPSQFQSLSIPPDTVEDPEASPASSNTGLLAPKPAVVGSTSSLSLPERPALGDAPTNVDKSDKGKKKQVHYVGDAEGATLEPAPPSEVLGRTATTVESTTSAAASVQSPVSTSVEDLVWGDVVLRDRMLVRINHTKAEDIDINFDESMHRTTRGLQYQDWAEFVVAWRKDIIEIYEDYATSLQEWAVGHKHLAYVIPLKSARTHLSLYSFVDMTFCITCPPMRKYSNSNQTKWKFSSELEGTNVYIFKTKSRSRAYDWTWQLWRHLGGQIPSSIDIRNPRLGTKVAIDLPGRDFLDTGKAAKMCSRSNIIALCMRSLKPVPGWNNFVEYERQRGRTLQLAWRAETQVDWVWLDQAADGTERDWAVLCGIAFKSSPQAPALELRVAEHYPTFLHLKNGTLLVEPPAVEGYVERIRPSTQTRQPLYLASYQGNLFTLTSQQAQPPSPPGSALMLDTMEEYRQNLRRVEFERGAYQMAHASGVCDLRSIIAVRRAFQNVPQQHHNQKDDLLPEDDSWVGIWSQANERTDSDDEDEGGEEGLSKATDKQRVKMKRSFELLLNTGRVVRFEVHSRRVANEWVEKLRTLVLYWKQRHRVNAKDEIDLAQARHPRVTPQIRVCDEHELPPENPDLSAPYPALDTLFNWCIIDGCRPIVKEGKLYMRKSLRGQYKLVHLFLTDGHLICFRVAPQNSLQKAMKMKINLTDAYICSGYLAALTLPEGQYKPNAPALARRYEDGLEADDRDEDMLFVILYRQHAAVIPPRPSLDPAGNSTTNSNASVPQSVPSLSEKHKLLVCRTRSKVERDAWCWALNIEIEKLTRKQKEREEKLRLTGNLRKIS